MRIHQSIPSVRIRVEYPRTNLLYIWTHLCVNILLFRGLYRPSIILYKHRHQSELVGPFPLLYRFPSILHTEKSPPKPVSLARFSSRCKTVRCRWCHFTIGWVLWLWTCRSIHHCIRRVPVIRLLFWWLHYKSWGVRDDNFWMIIESECSLILLR